ncbi:MAG: tetratricopeptide repeat protein [Gemmatimonadota bacterium]
MRTASKPSGATTGRTWLLLPGLMIAVAAAYYPAWRGGLVWDDAAHLTRPALQSLPGLWRIWTELGATQQYYPLTHSAFWLQHHLWGDDVLGYHLVNIGLHATVAFLIALILRRLAVPGAFLAAAIFALHPVQVESVAWISELKNTLSTTLYLAAAFVYLRFDERRDLRDYIVALTLFMLALLTKTVSATLPAALLVVFWWRRGTLRLRGDVAPLIPFFLLGIAAGLFTAWVERNLIGAQGAEFELSFIERALIAGRAVWFYLGKLIWPLDLSFIYPRWTISDDVSWQYLFPIGIVVLITVFWLLRRRSRAPLAVLLLFCGGLFPALGFVNVFPFRYSFVADHFQYLASIPVIALLSAAIVIAARRLNVNQTAALVMITLLLATPLAALTWRQSHDYASAERLYRATIARNPGAWIAHNNLGKLLADDGRVAEARAHFRQALRLNSAIPEHHMNLGRLLIAEGSLSEGIMHLKNALRLDPQHPDAHSNLGVGLLRQGRVEESMTHFEAALRSVPGHPEARINVAAAHQALGVAHAQAGRIEAALPHFQAAAHHNPSDAAIRHNLNMAMRYLNRD